MSRGDSHELGCGMHAKLAAYPLAMIVDRMDADLERHGDLFTRFALGYQPTDFCLSRCEFLWTHMHLNPESCNSML
jgi:hypothetical protein